MLLSGTGIISNVTPVTLSLICSMKTYAFARPTALGAYLRDVHIVSGVMDPLYTHQIEHVHRRRQRTIHDSPQGIIRARLRAIRKMPDELA